MRTLQRQINNDHAKNSLTELHIAQGCDCPGCIFPGAIVGVAGCQAATGLRRFGKFHLPDRK
jgi:hypothetical protein